MLVIFITLVGVALLLPTVALTFVVARWFVPACIAAREEEVVAARDATQFRPRFALSSVE